MSRRARIAVTGAGAVTPFGEGVEALAAGLASGASAIRPIARFDTSALRSRLAGLVTGFEPRRVIPPALLRRLDPTSRLAVPAAAQALDGAACAARRTVGVILGTNASGADPLAQFLQTIAREGAKAAPPILFPYTVLNAPASQCAINLGLRGPNLTVTQGEGSSAAAIAVACRMIASGAAEALLAGGADDVSPHVYEAYDRLGVLSRDRGGEGGRPEGSRPFDALRDGFVCGEAACFLFLESEESARGRGVRPIAYIEAVAEGRSPAPPHAVPTDPAPLAAVIRSALRSAVEQDGAIGGVFGSANGSRGMDAVEAEALRLAFDGAPPPVASVRGAVGESGAGGALSALAACLSLGSGSLPGTAGLVEPDAGLGLSVSAAGCPLASDRALVTGFSRGGSAVALILRAA